VNEFFTYIRENWKVLSKAKGAFLILMVVSFAAGYSCAVWYLNRQITNLTDDNNRYRRQLGIDPPGNTALYELNNDELKAKATDIVIHLRQFSAVAQANLDAVEARDKDADPSVKSRDGFQALKDGAQAYDANLASDAENIETELRRRLPTDELSNIPRVPAFGTKEDPRGPRLTITEIFRGNPGIIGLIPVLASEIEQMAKLLPNGPSTRQ
jgi:hypothetical protein